MESADPALSVLLGVVAVTNGGLGVAMLLRSRDRSGEVLWRGRRLVAPRLFGCAFLFLGLTFAAAALRYSVFASRSVGTLVAILAAFMFAVVATVAFMLWAARQH
ncbi:hypothetical protein [Phytohabitans kaempferiae]|uniref:Uncharacterized protein n=1 Tax=Phytohabitans kaempferiae TaxID=1620943 RepID=A0ABV6MHU1_9ACTN